MNILVTGAKGFIGRNLVENLKNIRDNKNRTRPNLSIGQIYEYDIDSTAEELSAYCSDCDFVFHFAGVNRPKDVVEFKTGNVDALSAILDHLKAHGNKCPVMLSGSIQATLQGRFEGSEYGKSKLAAEDLLFAYEAESDSEVYIYRFPNVAGKWCRPNYNSAVATFCNAIANDLEYTVNDRNTELEILFIDDLVNAMLDLLEGRVKRCDYSDGSAGDPGVAFTPIDNPNGRYCYVPVTHKTTLGEIVDLLRSFRALNRSLLIPEIPTGSLAYKLYSMYLSYLPEEKMTYSVDMKTDYRGTFAELIKTKNNGQVSINIARPGNMRGQHWHNTKWEIFIVVSGHGLIQERRIGTDPATGKDYPIHSFEVYGEEMKAIIMLPGYAHNIINLEEDKDLVTVMWANEQFDENRPDTFFEVVDEEFVKTFHGKK